MAGVIIPPWLQLDPLAPAKIRLQANAQRQHAAAQDRQAQLQEEEMQLRREQAAAHDAATERAAQRHAQVLRETRDQELAQAAAQMQMQRERQAQQAQQFQENLRLKQESAQREAKLAADQMQGMQAVKKGLEAGQPLQKLISENAPLLFARHPERITSAVPKGVTGPADYTAHQLRDEQGNPLGINVIPGAHGAIKPLPRTEMTPEGLLRADQLRLGVISKQLEEADPKSPEAARLIGQRDAIMNRLEQITSRRGAAAPALSPTPGALPGAPAAVSAPLPPHEDEEERPAPDTELDE
jgi:multidrug efflux pump subunit AcrA (membrane-fusion protein)